MGKKDQSCILLQLLLIICLTGISKALSILDGSKVQYRRGLKSDQLQMQYTMTRNLMNPLGIEPNRFIVACDASNENKIYGWAQLRPIGSSVKDPEQYDALDGSGSIEKEIYEEIWEDFESEEVAFPNGFASLPWTKEYREYSKSPK